MATREEVEKLKEGDEITIKGRGVRTFIYLIKDKQESMPVVTIADHSVHSLQTEPLGSVIIPKEKKKLYAYLDVTIKRITWFTSEAYDTNQNIFKRAPEWDREIEQ